MALKVDYEQLNTTAGNFRTEEGKIRDRAYDISKKMSELESGSSTEVLPELRQKFVEFQNGPLQNCLNLVENFAKHLEKVAELYKTEDTTLRENVSNVGNQSAFKQ